MFYSKPKQKQCKGTASVFECRWEVEGRAEFGIIPTVASERAGPVEGVRERSSPLVSPLHIKQVLCKYVVITIHHK